MDSATTKITINDLEKIVKKLDNSDFEKFFKENMISFITITSMVPRLEGYPNPNTLNIIYNIYAEYLKDPSIITRIPKLKKKTIIWKVNEEEKHISVIEIEDMYSELKTLDISRRQAINSYLDDAKLVLPIIEDHCERCHWHQA